MNLPHGLLQKGIKDIQTCIRKCLQAGGGVAPTSDTAATTPQICFGIDYDFATHRCYHHVSATVLSNAGTEILEGFPTGIMCDMGLTPATGLLANSNVVNIVICKYNTVPPLVLV